MKDKGEEEEEEEEEEEKEGGRWGEIPREWRRSPP